MDEARPFRDVFNGAINVVGANTIGDWGRWGKVELCLETGIGIGLYFDLGAALVLPFLVKMAKRGCDGRREVFAIDKNASLVTEQVIHSTDLSMYIHT
jgi:hypothetical protein